MRNLIKGTAMTLILVLFICPAGWGQTVVSDTINVSIERYEDSTQAQQKIFMINVNSATLSSNLSYTILFYLDNRYVQEFKNQVLPFYFKENFSGQLPGDHQIKIEVEDNNGHVLAAATVPLNI